MEQPPEREPAIQPQIREAAVSDLPALEAALPSPKGAHFHQDRLERQTRGESTYLVAYIGNEPVGNLDLRWTGSNQPEVADKITDCPELNAIAVRPDLQSRGVGTQLIKAAEDLAKGRGYRRVGLGVELSNPRAETLYKRLGYRDWGYGTYIDRWVEHRISENIEHADECHWLIKEL